MKKELKNYKALNSRIILVTIFILLIANRTSAQCTTSCQGNIDIDCVCITSTCYGSGNTYINDIPPYNTPQTTITIGDVNFTVDAKMTVTDIIITDNNGGGVGPTFSTADDFNTSAYSTASNITFNNGPNIEIIGTPTSAWVGYTFSFTVNVLNYSDEILTGCDNVTPASRSYYFEIKSAGYITGDTHITTVDGVRYDFQAVGEFVSLLGDNLEIQTRQTAVATNGPGHDSYDNLSTCVSVNTAVAARVGEHRVTYQPNINGIPDPSGMQLRVDGELTELGDNGLDLGSGGRVMKSPAGGGAIEIDFPDGTSLIVTPGWWSPYNQWYLNVSINNTSARKGISGVIAYNDTTGVITQRSKSWLPALPDGSSVGPMPESLHDRFVTLYQEFADAWRVTDQTSLFDYAPGTSTATFTDKNWPMEKAESCNVPGQDPEPPIALEVAEKLASGIVDPNLRPNAIYDVMVTGEPTFVKTYLLTQNIQMNTTAIGVKASKDKTKYEEPVTFTAIVSRKFSAGEDILTGSVEFNIDGQKFGQVELEANGRAILTTTTLKVGRHQIAATFIPDAGSAAFSSSSPVITHTVTPVFSLSAHGGRTFPVGNFSNSYTSDWLGEIDAEYHFSGAFSTELVAGYYNFVPGYKVIGAALYTKVHTTLGAFDGYLGAGPGFYKPDNVSGSFALSGKVGIQRPVINKLWVDLNAAYFKLFGPGNDINFYTTSLGIRLYF